MDSREIPVSGKGGEGKYILVDGDYDGEYFAQFKWHLTAAGYPTRQVWNRTTKKPVPSYLHREVCKPPEGQWVDHINGNKLDNRSSNLRWVTPSQNAQNRTKRKGAKHQYKGAVLAKSGKWYCFFKQKYVGAFDSEVEAAKKWDDCALREYGEYAMPNFPESSCAPQINRLP